MSSCDQCGKSILFGGQRLDQRRYCSAACARIHPLLEMADRVPVDILQRQVSEWRQSACPKCKRRDGAIDVHEHHRVHSLVLMTQWSTRRNVCCRRCGRREQLLSTLYCATLGWWGFPWGLLVTPVQIVRNVAALCRREADRPSAAFEQIVRRQIARHYLDAQATVPASP
ncbi:hypothetical protein SAMN04487785_10956 [Dyella jiangningensis]|uniref:hypothetical protein n=1 Tax=Dyella sp. AtDHG13 TaxID=1938897 RepID=UPI00088EEC68|nr:hypothetical protein [Dyella sp. AtDHG13]PXV56933.1 hypothetical protein BDW41_10855 [Dyella sp. AtDHG13]SDK61496.1 hypothetical protein SAMN04487785_10956 [Dyella jiangningensis]